MADRADFHSQHEWRDLEKVERQCYSTDYTIFSTTRGISLPLLKFLEKKDDVESDPE